jgi:hypothetical protein
MLLKNKKAQGMSFLFNTLFTLILAAFFIIAVFLKVKAASEDSTYQKRFYARDLALLVDSMHSANGEVSIDYYFDFSQNITVKAYLSDDRVILLDSYDSIDKKKSAVSFLYARNNETEIISTAEKNTVSQMKIILDNSTISFIQEKPITEFIPGGGLFGGAGASGTY